MSGAIRDWLAGIGLEQYASAFEDNDIDADLIAALGDSDLRELGVVSLGHRKRLLRSIEALKPSGLPAEAASAPALALEPKSDALLMASAAPASGSTPRSSQAERRQLTVMFCDLADSTRLSTELDPEDYRELIRSYQQACAAIIARQGGFLARYLGDGLLAYFGWPQSNEDDAERAVNAGLGIVAAVRGLPRKDGARPLAVRVGIATGPVVVGDIIGEGAAEEAAVTGVTPNLAARLQQIAAPDSVVIAPATRLLLGDLFVYQSLGPRELKGIGQAIEPFLVTAARPIGSRFEATRGQQLRPLVGRRHELALLEERWESARQGEGQAVLLAGEAGIGKSRLVQALIEHVGGTPHFRIRFQCSPNDASSAFSP
ncbi:MAG: adenylate/guanylate cyclase domain-containing protein, partial [Devosia sp.]